MEFWLQNCIFTYICHIVTLNFDYWSSNVQKTWTLPRKSSCLTEVHTWLQKCIFTILKLNSFFSMRYFCFQKFILMDLWAQMCTFAKYFVLPWPWPFTFSTWNLTNLSRVMPLHPRKFCAKRYCANKLWSDGCTQTYTPMHPDIHTEEHTDTHGVDITVINKIITSLNKEGESDFCVWIIKVPQSIWLERKCWVNVIDTWTMIYLVQGKVVNKIHVLYRWVNAENSLLKALSTWNTYYIILCSLYSEVQVRLLMWYPFICSVKCRN